MCRCGEANEAASERPEREVCTSEESCSLAGGIEIVSVEVVIDAPEDRVIMNDPQNQALVTATVTYVESEADDALEDVPPVRFTFSDHGADNTRKTDSYEYSSGNFLGKRDDTVAVHWAAHADYATTSANSYRTSARVTGRPVSGARQVISRIWFKPSGVGGDDFRVRATVHSPDGSVELASDETDTFTVWRALDFDRIYEMQGETHVSTNASTATISPVFDPAFVRYRAGARTELGAAHSVKYIGLWQSTSTPQQSWAALHAKRANERPTARETAEATYSGSDPAELAKRPAARNAIIAKAQRWTDRIDAAFRTARDQWITDAGIPEDAIVGIRYYHPKYSSAGGDAQTTEWRLGGASTPAWLRVGAFPRSGGGHYYTGVDPDGLWRNWVGLSHGNGRVTIPKGRPAAAITQTIRHEAGHATRSHFKRDVFGPSLDHSTSNAGIMYRSSALGGTTFSTREKKILRGIVP